LLPAPAELRIVQEDVPRNGISHSGFYLLYLDDNNAEMTDTWHETLEDAMAQAEWEFQVQPEEWEMVG